MKKLSWRRVSIYAAFTLVLSLLTAFDIKVPEQTLDAIVTVTVTALGAFGLEDAAKAIGSAWQKTKEKPDA